MKLLLLLATLFARTALIARGAEDAYGVGGGGQSLYDSSDDVVVLNFTNLKSSVYRSDRGWLVEFYNSWCGFCRRFAPTWKSLAREIRGWRNVVTVAALDCADDDNNPVCREYEIMRYPEVRYFAPGQNPGDPGVDVEKSNDANGLRRNLLTRLRKEQEEGRGDRWPNLTPLRSSEVKNVWERAPASVLHYFLLFEEPDSYLASEVILDLRNATSLLIRSVTSDNALLCLQHEITRFPSLVVYSRRGDTRERLSLRPPTRKGARDAIVEFARSKGVELDVEDATAAAAAVTTTMPLPESYRRSTMKNSIARDRSTEGDILYPEDLEAALRFSLGHEIPMARRIAGERMAVLKNYTRILASYLPRAPIGKTGGWGSYLGALRDAIESRNEIGGEEFGKLVASIEEKAPSSVAKTEWIGCRPSRTGLRGYPCGLWLLFHTLTVNFATRSYQETTVEPSHVLRTIRGYVENFFGCAECARHFATMATRTGMAKVASADESAMWLWRAHNEVNARLAGDETEDPEHKKIRYPSLDHCPNCRNGSAGDDKWNEAEVLAYLKRKYAPRFGVEIPGDGTTSSSSRSSTSSGDVLKRSVNFERMTITRDRTSVGVAPPSSVRGITAARKFGWDFTVFDISICVVLYVVSAAILVLVCIKFAVKKSHKRRTHVHSILGKV